MAFTIITLTEVGSIRGQKTGLGPHCQGIITPRKSGSEAKIESGTMNANVIAMTMADAAGNDIYTDGLAKVVEVLVRTTVARLLNAECHL